MSNAGTVVRTSAEEKLLVAACEMLAEVGPRAASVRAVAARAGVNHGLVHHYFGSKDALLRAAMSRLVHEHSVSARAFAGRDGSPAPLGLLRETRYLHAVVRCILDGEMGLARTELDEDVSVPRDAYRAMRRRAGADVDDARVKAMAGIGMALEMGWAAVEPFIAAVTGTDSEGMEDVRREAVKLRNDIARTYLA